MGKKLEDLVKTGKVIKKNKYYSLPASFFLLPSSCFLLPSSFDIRLRRRRASAPKFRLAARVARLIGLLPSVKLVCLTGALAMENSDENDDIDLMIVTSPNRLWLTRPLVVLLVSLFFKRRRPIPSALSLQPLALRNALCLNLWLDASALAMPPHRQDLRTAHELAQMKPLVNKDKTYEKMLSLNKWEEKFLANFWQSVMHSFGPKRLLPSSFFLLPSLNNLLNLINYFFFRLQYLYMRPKLTSEEVTLHSAFFHPTVRRISLGLLYRY